MDEAGVKHWLVDHLGVPRETLARLDAFVELLTARAGTQNLISASTIPAVWSRHILDSAQLIDMAPSDASSWLDLGTGAGFPGLIVAALHPAKVTMVEQRRLRADFLAEAASVLDVADRCEIICARLERMPDSAFDVISARAFAPLEDLWDVAEKFSHSDTLWLLPKGRNAQTELAAAESSWQGDFRLEPSLTDPEARIIVAKGVQRRKGKRTA